jgi:hypothetical protein
MRDGSGPRGPEAIEALVIKRGAGILEEEPGVPAVFQSRPDLSLPELAGKGIRRIRDEG